MKEDIAKLLSPPRKAKLHESIVSQLKGLIHSKKLAVDDKLPSERELANLFSVSRVVVRESIQALEQAGLIEIRTGPSGGAFVVRNLHKPLVHAASDMFHGGELTLQYFYEARRAIECAIIRLAVEKAKPKDLKRLRQINAKLLTEIEERDRLRANNSDFHLAVAQIAGNPLLTMMLQSILELLDIVYPKSMQSEEYIKNTYARHDAIIEAMERKDHVRCDELMAIDTEHTTRLTT
ncbi:MAG: FadR family transcriptional regulator [Syntrophorhabdus sp.]|nr:FadR family transcriptional regulator [Syntrophorhabdus sp.]